MEDEEEVLSDVHVFIPFQKNDSDNTGKYSNLFKGCTRISILLGEKSSEIYFFWYSYFDPKNEKLLSTSLEGKPHKPRRILAILNNFNY